MAALLQKASVAGRALLIAMLNDPPSWPCTPGIGRAWRRRAARASDAQGRPRPSSRNFSSNLCLQRREAGRGLSYCNDPDGIPAGPIDGHAVHYRSGALNIALWTTPTHLAWMG
jgi:hypothetical protein